MRQPYGSGLDIPPDAGIERFLWPLTKAWRRVARRCLWAVEAMGLGWNMVSRIIWVKDCIGREIRNYTVIHPPETVHVALPSDAEFLSHVHYYKSGTLDLAEAFVCEVTPAHYFPHLGIVANNDFEVFGDSVLLQHRFEASLTYRSFRPSKTVFYPGPISSVQRIDAYNFWHWFADCLPQVLLLEQYMKGEPLTLLMTDDLAGFQRETLMHVVGPKMHVEFVPNQQWIRTDRFVLPSYVSGRRNGYLRKGYYEEITRRIRVGLGAAEPPAKPDLRLYLSRATTKRRRVANEDALVALLESYGFTTVLAERYSMREQVEMFGRAEAIVAPHGAALGGMVFSPHAKLLVIYPEQSPGEYFYTMARCLGLEHHGLVQDSTEGEDAINDFTVDLKRLEAILAGPMALAKREQPLAVG